MRICANISIRPQNLIEERESWEGDEHEEVSEIGLKFEGRDTTSLDWLSLSR